MKLDFKYLRIQGKEFAENTMWQKGVFSMCMQMLKDEVMEQEDAELFLELNDWFAHELPWPEPCMRQEKVICWFKVENAEIMMKMMKPVMWLLEKYNHPYYLVFTNFPGEIVYEDKYQVCCKADGHIVVEALQESWSPKDEDKG